MGRRGRAIGFASAAAICAGLAAGTQTGAGGDLAARYGELREVVVATETLGAGRALGRGVVAETLEVRRVPERFVPPEALASPAQALGSRPIAPVPAGSYLLASQFRTPGARTGTEGPRLSGDRTPVEIAVAGAGALAGSRPGRVDVVVTTEASPTGGPGKTFVAARNVRLLGLQTTGEADAVLPRPAAAGWLATLALTHPQALRLIHAQSYARELRLIGR